MKLKRHLFVFLHALQCKVDKLVVIDSAENSAKGGSTDLEIFDVPKVEVSRGMSLSAQSLLSSLLSSDAVNRYLESCGVFFCLFF